MMVENINKNESHKKGELYSFCKENYDFESSISSSLESVEENIQGSSSWLISNLKIKKTIVHKRKGVPRRAPLC